MADKTFGTSSLILNTDSTQLDQGLKQVDSQVTGFVTSIGSGVSVIATGGWGAVIAGGAKALGVISSVWDSMTSSAQQFADKVNAIYDDIREQGKQAAQVGLSTSGFQSLLAGAKVDADTLTQSLGHMQRSISELNQGSAAAAQTFGRLGLSAKDLTGDTDQQFRKLISTIGGLKNPADQAAAAFRVFGKSGSELLPQIRAGNFDEVIAKSKELGIILSDDDAIGMAKVSKTWSEVSRIGKGLFQSFAASVVPLFQGAADLTKAAWEAVAPVFKKVADVLKYVSSFIVAVFAEIKERIEPTINIIKVGLIDGFEKLKQSAIPILEKIAAFFGVELNLSIQSSADVFKAFVIATSQGAVTVLNAFLDFGGKLLDRVAPVALELASKFISALKFIAPVIIWLENDYIDLGNKVLQITADIISRLGAMANSMAAVALAAGQTTLGLQLKHAADAAEDAKNSLRDFKIPHVDAKEQLKVFDDIQAKILTMKKALPSLADDLRKMKINPDDVLPLIEGIFDRMKQGSKDTAADMANDFGDAVKISDKMAGAFQKNSKEAGDVIYQAQYGSNSMDKTNGLLQEGNKNGNRIADGVNQLIDAIRNQPDLVGVA